MLVLLYSSSYIEMGSEQRMRRTAFLMTNALWGVQGLCISTADLVSYPHVLEITSGGLWAYVFNWEDAPPRLWIKYLLSLLDKKCLVEWSATFNIWHIWHGVYHPFCAILSCSPFIPWATYYHSFYMPRLYHYQTKATSLVEHAVSMWNMDELTAVTICHG